MYVSMINLKKNNQQNLVQHNGFAIVTEMKAETAQSSNPVLSGRRSFEPMCVFEWLAQFYLKGPVFSKVHFTNGFKE